MPESPTGRLGNNEPNIQNIPTHTPEGDKIREALTKRPPPTRCSIEVGSPHYAPHVSNNVRVFFDGVEQTQCTEYHVLEGWIKRFKTTKFGLKVKDRTGRFFIQETIHGQVEVRWKD